jgi:hypothetical protein
MPAGASRLHLPVDVAGHQLGARRCPRAMPSRPQRPVGVRVPRDWRRPVSGGVWSVQDPETGAELFRVIARPDDLVTLILDGHEVEDVPADTAEEIRTFLGVAIGQARWGKVHSGQPVSGDPEA